MIIRARAPLRIGFAGGGTDVSPYSDIYGGAVLNASISMFAYASLEPTDDGKITFNSIDRGITQHIDSTEQIETDGELSLVKAVYNRVVKDYLKNPLSFKLTTYVDAPAGSGLGSSSTIVVAILGAMSEWLQIPLGEYDIAHLAYDIERIDMKMAGGKQDQYSATFGGINYMEFYKDDRVIVNPLRVKPEHLRELEHNLLLYYTGTSRLSSEIIRHQIDNVTQKSEKPINAMHELKEQAVLTKEAILKGNLCRFGELLDYGWQQKKQISSNITNPVIDEIYSTAIKAGATGGKISGAGGGGFMFFYCPDNNRYNVIEAIKKFGGEFRRYKFEENGLIVWKK